MSMNSSIFSFCKIRIDQNYEKKKEDMKIKINRVLCNNLYPKKNLKLD